MVRFGTRTNSVPVYSNLGFDVLGSAVARARGATKGYAALIDDLITRPLGMTNTGVNISEALGRPGWRETRLALPFVEAGTALSRALCM